MYRTFITLIIYGLIYFIKMTGILASCNIVTLLHLIWGGAPRMITCRKPWAAWAVAATLMLPDQHTIE